MGLDVSFENYIKFSDAHPIVNTVKSTEIESAKEEFSSELERAIVKGLRGLASESAKGLIVSSDPIEMIEKYVIPALDRVGKDYESGKIYLPGLLMSAEAAGEAFEVIRSHVDTSSTDKCEVLLATVKGDIHDIGKNIVKMLLENYGFTVIDLGRDVSAKCIVEEVEKRKIPIVGLSALMTTTVPAMKETIELLHERVPDTKIIVGGAVLTEEYAKKIGADYYAKDAMDGVRIALEINKTFK
jgi:5-methyltetrahydrofolate--homocysteine methyltransferase